MEVFKYKKPLDLMAKSKPFWYLVFGACYPFFGAYFYQRVQLWY